MLPLFSTSVSPPVRSTIAPALPWVPPATAVIWPLLVIVPTPAPCSTKIARTAVGLVPPPPAAAITPLLAIAGTVAPLPMRIAVAPALPAWAPIAPLTVRPPAT